VMPYYHRIINLALKQPGVKIIAFMVGRCPCIST